MAKGDIPIGAEGLSNEVVSESTYRAICQACDSILLAAGASSRRLAIPWLHVIREHAFFLQQYVDLQVSYRTLAWSVAGWVKQLWQGVSEPGFGFEPAVDFPSQVDALIVSHLVNIEHLTREADFYFDALPRVLLEHGYSVAVALIDHTSKGVSHETTAIPSGHVVLRRSMSFAREAANLMAMWRESGRLRREARTESDPLRRGITGRAAMEALGGGARATCRLGTQIGELVNRLQPKMILTTYEGHAWERLAYDAARQARPGIRCAGFQHANLFRLQHALRRNLGSGYDPDVIYTSGRAAQRQLENSPALRGTDVRVLGSNRSGARMSPDARPDSEAKRAAPVCLVIPDGLDSEMVLLFEYALHCADKLRDVTFIWRLHPAVSLNALVDRYSTLRQRPSNVVISTASLQDDARRARWALYRGSSAIVASVLAGASPVYLRVDQEMTIDPLYELDDARAIVSTVDDFVDLVVGRRRTYPTEAQVEAVESHCLDIFSPPMPEVVVHDLNQLWGVL